uniref:GOLD domain-containing protein n=1 Tax=Corethron hystrix TaxID=216773 RepID=A0A7S1BRI9_9STRA|mmetsp:Transcript_3845/g.7259  ORF Transcript_3845/g.7259 Transcript_3845/m.7259 type:complete len:508 (+) Transcript_3845:140-1663(+)|eukprot:CAMPEP_0113301394 /NCGR_PEP_ID=MMETSP0010_2-20120614/2643_1 /TAXON_ID=216773 ORGANISM="Corethron hystrix, Strain 308" /NCGR_SAMPLE_ID=MMETSP0010_2 /ASSEMBLY_ACC=CAM_ASM_000155 /LENGTH=507 /DNA_ID=CAMNT_0000155013 /DNA_START=30 /DNA_END=1553 /DNA_ORIENTATION=+ /assembly_acc=CAM_ASM_000155
MPPSSPLFSSFLILLLRNYASGADIASKANAENTQHMHLPSPPLSQQYIIAQRRPRCLYTLLRYREHMTTTVFATESSNSDTLRADVMIRGPFATLTPKRLAEHDAYYGTGQHVAGGKDGIVDPALQKNLAAEDAKKRGVMERPPQTAEEIYGPGTSDGGNIIFQKRVDFENILNEERPPVHEHNDDDYTPMLDDYAYDHYNDWYAGGDDMVSNTDAEKTTSRRRLVNEGDRGKGKYEKKRRPDETGGAFMHTIEAQSGDAGWYSVCVSSIDHDELKAEISLRKSTSVALRAGENLLDPRTGHVMTFEDVIAIANERINFAKPEDLRKTGRFINLLRHKVNSIKEAQTTNKHRMDVHAFVNERSQKQMIRKGRIDMLVFFLVTFLQLYSIRSWFSGSNSMAGGGLGSTYSIPNKPAGNAGNTAAYGEGGHASAPTSGGYGYNSSPTFGQAPSYGGYSAGPTQYQSNQYQPYDAGQQRQQAPGEYGSAPGLARRGNAAAGGTGGGYNY